MVKFGAPLSDDDSDVEDTKMQPVSRFTSGPPRKSLPRRNGNQQAVKSQPKRGFRAAAVDISSEDDEEDYDEEEKLQRGGGMQVEERVEPSSSHDSLHRATQPQGATGNRYFLQSHLGLDASRLHLMNSTLFSEQGPYKSQRNALDDLWQDIAPRDTDMQTATGGGFGSSDVAADPDFAKLDALDDLQDGDDMDLDVVVDLDDSFAVEGALPSPISPIYQNKPRFVENSPALLPSPMRPASSVKLAQYHALTGPAAEELEENVKALPSQLPAEAETVKNHGFASRHIFRVGWSASGVFTRVVGGRVILTRLNTVPSDHSTNEYRAFVGSSLTTHLVHKHDREEEKVSEPVISSTCNAHVHMLGRDDSASNLMMPSPTMTAHRRNLSTVWSLVRALWCPTLGDQFEGGSNAVATYRDTPLENFARREALSAWLRQAVTHDVVSEVKARPQSPNPAVHAKNALSYLTGYQIHNAVHEATASRDFRLAMLLSQAGEDANVRSLVGEQIRLWKQSSVWDTFDEDHKRMYEILAGVVSFNREEAAALNLDWLRTFGLHLWYGPHANTAVRLVMREYDAFIERRTLSGGSVEEDTCLPFVSNGKPGEVILDLRYHLIQLYCNDSYPQANLFSPENFVKSKLDFHLSWLLLDVLQNINVNPFPRLHDIVMSYASQLVSLGLYKWAVYVVMTTRIPSSLPQLDKASIVKPILFRQCPETEKVVGDVLSDKGVYSSSLVRGGNLGDSVEMIGSVLPIVSEARKQFAEAEEFLIANAAVPAEWFHEARALRAKYDAAPFSEMMHLRRAGHWKASHAILTERIAPSLIVREDLSTLSELLQSLELHSHNIESWSSLGGYLLEYCGLESRLSQSTGNDIVLLQQYVNGLLSRLDNFRAALPEAVVSEIALSEMAARLTAVLSNLHDSPLDAHLHGISAALPENHRLTHLRDMCLDLLSA